MDIAKKIIKIGLKIGYQLLIIMCVLLILIIAMQRLSDSNRSIGGYKIFRVITGSMVPEYDIGEVVISKEVSKYDIKIGDDIVYIGKIGDYAGKIIMHKVTQIDEKEDGTLIFHAKGLHIGSVEDPTIKADQILGVVKIKSGILTMFYNLATSIYSAFIIISILVLNVFISFKFPGNVKNKIQDENYEEEDVEEEIEESEETEIETEIEIEQEEEEILEEDENEQE